MAEPYVLVVDADADRRIRMLKAAQDDGLEVDAVDTQRGALQQMRTRLPDVLVAGALVKGGSTKELFELVATAWPQLPRLALVPSADLARYLPLLQSGAFDVMRDDDHPLMWRAGLRRALAELRALDSIRDERGRFLAAQSRLTVMPAALEEMLTGLAEALREALNKPDISLRRIETVCASALSRFLDGAVVVVMAYERGTGVLRPRGASHESDEHQLAADSGFLLTEDLDNWKTALRDIGSHAALVELVRETYKRRQALLAMIGPAQEPYGAAAYLTNNARPLHPDEEELLRQVTAQVGQIIRVARVFRQLLRRNVTNT
ncbi:MAG: hypothetical protein HY904_14655 [Deltaproteobacteria bacterium]|nr:hypothetical protein [Deltaproteobacteria bacterium]